jgi:predicted membrane channel-forming protein YqfA (hemolysin III family)
MPYAIIAIPVVAIIVIGFVVLAVRLKRRKQEEVRPIDYRTFFILGICWLPMGIIFWIVMDLAFGIPLFVMGGTFLTIGLLNRVKWTEPQTLTGGQRKLMIGSIVGGTILFLFMLGISSFVQFSE